MNTLIRSLQVSLILLAFTGFSACEKNAGNTGMGTAGFSLSLPDEAGPAKSDTSTVSGIISYQLMVSIEDMEGNIIMTDSLIPLYVFGTGFISENLELVAGEYKLTKFLVINPSGEVIFAAPVKNSPLAYLVKRPLPLIFNIYPDQLTRIVPEVLAVGGYTPDQFGYASFGLQIIKPLHFWTICVVVPQISDIAVPLQPTTAKLTVFAPDGWHYTFRLQATVNHLVIRGGYPVYKFLLEKEGYMPQTMEFTARELLATTKDNPLVLKIPWGINEWKVLILQPGPDEGKDAMVSNLEPDKNFGDHRYFEATFLSEPVLTVMRSNRSLIWFDRNALPKSAIIRKVTLQLFYDIPIPFDSSYLTDTDPSTGIAWYGGVLQQIVEPWEEYKVTWNTQPKTIEANQVFIPPFIRNVNFIVVDVTRLFVPLQEIAAPNYGMFFKLWPTEKFPGFRFASSDYEVTWMRPKLTIYYTIN